MNGTSNSIQLKLVKASGKVVKKQKFWQRNKSDLQKIASFVKSKTKNFIKCFLQVDECESKADEDSYTCTSCCLVMIIIKR